MPNIIIELCCFPPLAAVVPALLLRVLCKDHPSLGPHTKVHENWVRNVHYLSKWIGGV